MNEQSKPHILSGWRFTLLFIAVILTVIGYSLVSFWGGWEDVTSSISQFGVQGILFTLALTCSNYFFRYVRWQMFFRLLGYEVPLLKGLGIYISGFALSITPSKAGEAIRNIFLVDLGVPHRQSLGAMLAERFADMLAVVLLTILGFYHYSQGRPAILISFTLLGLGLYALQRDSWLKAMERWMDRILPERFSRGIDFFIETILHLRTCFRIKPLLMGIALGILAWGAEATAFYFLIQMLGYDLPYFMAIFIFNFALLVGAITFLPGGLGGIEAALINLLLLQDVSFSDAVAITIVIRICTLWFSVLLGLLVLPTNRVRSADKPCHSTSILLNYSRYDL